MAQTTRPPLFITWVPAQTLVFLSIGRVILPLCVCQGVHKGPWLSPFCSLSRGCHWQAESAVGPAWAPLLGELEKWEGNLLLLSKDLGAVVKEGSQAFHKRKVSLPLLAGEVLPGALSLTISPAHLHLGSSGKEAQGARVVEVTWNK